MAASVALDCQARRGLEAPSCACLCQALFGAPPFACLLRVTPAAAVLACIVSMWACLQSVNIPLWNFPTPAVDEVVDIVDGPKMLQLEQVGVHGRGTHARQPLPARASIRPHALLYAPPFEHRMVLLLLPFLFYGRPADCFPLLPPCLPPPASWRRCLPRWPGCWKSMRSGGQTACSACSPRWGSLPALLPACPAGRLARECACVRVISQQGARPVGGCRGEWCLGCGEECQGACLDCEPVCTRAGIGRGSPPTSAWPPPAPLPVQDFDAEEQEQIEEEHESGERAFFLLK